MVVVGSHACVRPWHTLLTVTNDGVPPATPPATPPRPPPRPDSPPFNSRLTGTATKEEALPDGDRPADILIQRSDAKGTAAVDVTCTHPLKVSDNNTTVDMARKSFKAAQDRERRKFHRVFYKGNFREVFVKNSKYTS